MILIKINTLRAIIALLSDCDKLAAVPCGGLRFDLVQDSSKRISRMRACAVTAFMLF